MKCPNCNTEVGGLVELELLLRKCNVYGFDSNCEFKKAEVMRNQLANKILSRFGTPKEKAEMEELHVTQIINDQMTMMDKGKDFTGYERQKIAKAICAKFSIPKTNENVCKSCGGSSGEYPYCTICSTKKTSEVSVEDIVKLMVDYRYNVADGAIAIHKLLNE